jgi:hypothetical protein
MEMGLSQAVRLLLLLTFLTSSTILFAFMMPAEAESMAAVRFIPGLVVVDHVAEQFTVACVVENVTGLEGFTIQMSWNTTYLQYLSHTATVPFEDYPESVPPSPYGGILHEPEVKLKDEAQEVEGTYWAAFATLGGSSFNGCGTVFVMTFISTQIPFSPPYYVDTYLHFESVDLIGSEEVIECTKTDGVVRILAWGAENHDVAVVDVSTSKAGCLPIPTVGQGYSADIIFDVENQGDYVETFNVAVYGNTTLILTVNHITLTQRETKTIITTWNTGGWAKGKYTVTVTAESVSGEIDPTDNSMTDELIMITLPGDVNGDKDVDIYDIVRMSVAYGVSKPDPQYDPNCDIKNDGDIDIYDIVAACNHYGETYL